jgi:anti-sigma regulatory factor (Ser/Thr protein kinase)
VEPLVEPESISLAPEADSVGAARRFAVDAADGLVDDDRRDVLELLVSETVTNAVIHAQTWCSMALCRHGDRLLVQIEDESPHRPHLKPRADEHGGWGMRLLASLAHDWGVERRPIGKCVWFIV